MTSVVHVIARMNVGGPAALLVKLLEQLPGQTLLTGEVEVGEADHLALRSSAPRSPGCLDWVVVLGLSTTPGPSPSSCVSCAG